MFIINVLLIDWFERERERLICCSTSLCIHRLLSVCALTGDQTHNLGVSGWCSNPLSYPARVCNKCLLKVWLLGSTLPSPGAQYYNGTHRWMQISTSSHTGKQDNILGKNVASWTNCLCWIPGLVLTSSVTCVKLLQFSVSQLLCV